MKVASTTPTNVPVLPNYIAANLRLLRKAEGWSQAELAERVHLNRGNIASYESGSADPSICKTLRISNLFGISARDLIRRDLSEPEELTLARLAYSLEERDRRVRIEGYQTEAEQFVELIASSRRLFDYKRANVTKPCPEADILAAHYEQLHQLTVKLLDGHQALLAEVGCQGD